MNAIIVFLKVSIVLIFIFVGWKFINPANHVPFFIPEGTPGHEAFRQHGFGGVLGGAAIVFFAFIGFDAVSTAAQEAKNPKRDMPIGILGDKDVGLSVVGASREVKTIAAAAGLARDGATVEVDAGDYVGDTAVWTQNDISLRAVGGRVRLIAAGKAADGKGIWVVRGERMVVEGFDFSGAAVPDRNGAGIRLDRGSLRVRDCSFTHNEMGILTNSRWFGGSFK